MGATPGITAGINTSYYAHAASANKGHIKRCVMLAANQVCQPNLETDASWPLLASWASWLRSEFADRDYLRVNGIPVVGFFSPSEWAGNAPGNANTLANYNTLIGLLGEVYKVGFGAISTPSATTLKLQGFTVYDTGGGAQLSPNGQHPWSDQFTKDASNWGQAGFDLVGTLSVSADDRPRHGEAGCGWADSPTPPDQITAIQAFGLGKLLFLSPSTEIDESGGIVSQLQDGDRYLRVAGWARGRARPGTYTYTIAARLLYCAATVGTWPRTTAISGAYDGEARRSATTSDIFSLTCDTHIISSNSSCTVEPLAEKGPDRGIVEVLVDGVSQGTVDLYAAGASENNSIGSYTVATGKRIDFRVNGTKNGSSSGFTCGINAWRITYAP